MLTSLPLPPELYDKIIDQLRDQSDALKSCSVVSKSWTPRSRHHLFSTIRFGSDLGVVAWQNKFSDACNPPAHHARTLLVRSVGVFPENPFSSLCNVTRLSLDVHPSDGQRPISFSQLHGFAPSLKLFQMTFKALGLTEVLNLVCSFPLLDHLGLWGQPIPSDTKFAPATPSPTFSGSLCLMVPPVMRIVANQLISLPGGINFRELVLPWFAELSATEDLISACSHSLESLHLLSGVSRTYPFGTFLFFFQT